MPFCTRRTLIASAAGLGPYLYARSLYAAPRATLSYAVLGDTGNWNSLAASVRASVDRAGIRDLILPGDNLYDDDDYATVWDNWAGYRMPVVALGNHNIGYDAEMAFFGMPGEYYRYDPAPGVRFLVLNSDNRRNVPEQMEWFENELRATDLPALTFAVWHHPSYSVSWVHNWQERRSFQEKARRLVQVYQDRLTAVLSGHDHISGFYQMGSVPLIVSGSTWDLRAASPVQTVAEDRVAFRSAWVFARPEPTWAKLVIDPVAARARVDFIRAADDAVVFSAPLGSAPRLHAASW